MTYPTLDELPAEAHMRFECPFCKLKGVQTILSTKQATNLRWSGEKAEFTGIGCFACKKSLTFTATRTTAPG